MGEKRRLPTTIKQQPIRYARYLSGVDRWSQTVDLILTIKSEIVPPEFRSRKRKFKGYTTIFEALAIASSPRYRSRTLVLYQSELHPLASQGTQSRWFGRFHLFKTARKRTFVSGGTLWATFVETSDLPRNAVTFRVLGLYSPKRAYHTVLREILGSNRFVKANPGQLFFRPAKRISDRQRSTAEAAAREFHAKIADLLMAQGCFLDDEIAELKENQNVALAPRGDTATGTASVDKLNLVSLDASAAVRAIADDGTIHGKELTKEYHEGKTDVAGFAVLVGERALVKPFTTLLTYLDHEARHVLQNLRARRWVDDWRSSGSTRTVEKFVQEAITRKRPAYTQSHYRNLLGFIGDTTQETRSLNEMRPYLEQLKLDLVLADWGDKDQQDLIRSIGTYQYNYFVDSDPTFVAMTGEWAPTFRRRYNALEQSRQESVRQLLEGFGPTADGREFAQFLLSTISARP